MQAKLAPASHPPTPTPNTTQPILGDGLNLAKGGQRKNRPRGFKKCPRIAPPGDFPQQIVKKKCKKHKISGKKRRRRKKIWGFRGYRTPCGWKGGMIRTLSPPPEWVQGILQDQGGTPMQGYPHPPWRGRGVWGMGSILRSKNVGALRREKMNKKITKTMPLGGTTGSFGVPPRVRQTHSPSPPPLRGPTLKNPQVGGRTPFLPLCAKPTLTFIPCLFWGGVGVEKQREGRSKTPNEKRHVRQGKEGMRGWKARHTQGWCGVHKGKNTKHLFQKTSSHWALLR